MYYPQLQEVDELSSLQPQVPASIIFLRRVALIIAAAQPTQFSSAMVMDWSFVILLGWSMFGKICIKNFS